jgi:hypothetical protein
MYLLLTLLIPLTVVRGAELNAGFVQGLWYGSEDIIANEPTRIYVALRNNTDHDLTGTVRFNDNGTRIGIAYVNALPGRIVEAWVDWTPQYGEHIITASLSDVRVHTIGETPETGEVENTIAEDTVFVDYDTDADGTPNEKDTDDDNDGVSDVDENTRGTNPLKADKKSEESTDATKEERAETEDASDDTPLKESTTDTLPTPPVRSGLEQYVPEGTAKNIVTNLTETIDEKRNELDTYRNERNDAIKEYFKEQKETVEETTTLPDGTATITRKQIQKEESFFESAVRGGKALISGFYSLILWMTSRALAHPAVLELLLLLFIVYITYRTARRLGRRRTNSTN